MYGLFEIRSSGGGKPSESITCTIITPYYTVCIPHPSLLFPFELKPTSFSSGFTIWSSTPPYTHEGPTTTLHDEMMLYSTLLPVQFAVFSMMPEHGKSTVQLHFQQVICPPRCQRTPYCMHYSRRNCRLKTLWDLIVKSRCTPYLQFKKLINDFRSVSTAESTE